MNARSISLGRRFTEKDLERVLHRAHTLLVSFTAADRIYQFNKKDRTYQTVQGSIPPYMEHSIQHGNTTIRIQICNSLKGPHMIALEE